MPEPIIRMRRPDARVLFSSQYPTLQLARKGSVAVGARQGGNTNAGTALIPLAAVTDVIAVRSTFGVARYGVTTVSGQLYANYACAAASGTLYYWAFTSAANLVRSAPGVTLRKMDGTVTWSSSYDAFSLATVLPDGAISVPVDGSRITAAVVSSFAGHRRAPGDGIYYINGQPVMWDGEARSANTRWQYRNDGKLYGAHFDGGNAYRDEISYDDVILNLNTGSTPAPFPSDWDVPLGPTLIVDVTGV